MGGQVNTGGDASDNFLWCVLLLGSRFLAIIRLDHRVYTHHISVLYLLYLYYMDRWGLRAFD